MHRPFTVVAVIMEFSTIEGYVPAAEARDVIAAALLFCVGAFDGGSLSSGLVLVSAVFWLVEGLADGAVGS